MVAGRSAGSTTRRYCSPSFTTCGSGRNGASAAFTPTGPEPGPPPPCGVAKVLCRLNCMTSKPMSPGRATPSRAFMLAPSPYTSPPLAWTISAISAMCVSKMPEGVGVGDHDGGDVLVHRGAHRLGVEPPVRPGGELHHRVAVQRRRGRVGAVGGVGDEHLLPRVAARLVVGADHHEAAQLAVGAGGRGERGGVEAGDLAERPLQPVHELERALAELGRGQRVERPRSRAGGPAPRSTSGCTSWCRSRAGRSRCRCRGSRPRAA